MKPLEGYQVEREGTHAVALELELDDDLRREGLARDIVRAVQMARQQAGLDVTDRIALTLDGDDTLLEAARSYQEYIAGETLATTVSYESQPDGSGAAQSSEAGGQAGRMPEGAAPVDIEGRELRIGVALA
jgi:isoleucyl-tRNA synthetase